MTSIHRYIFFILPLAFTSCQVMKESARDALVESVQDPKSGAQVFVREDPNSPYEFNVGGIVKARKQMKKEKLKKELERY